MIRSVASLLLSFGLLVQAASAGEKPSHWRTVWRISEGLLAGANAADAASSWGKDEANPLLRTGTHFGFGSLAIKLGVIGGGLTAQHFIVRKNPNQVRLYSIANLATAGALSAVAVHNMSIPAPPK